MEEQVKSIFSTISKRYEFANSVLSFGRDRYWRQMTVEKLALKGGEKVLDVCTGTGEMAFLLSEKLRKGGEVVGVDFCEEMLQSAQEKARKIGRKNLFFKKANALNLPFSSGSFDAVTIAFGLRNLTDRKKGLKELRRILKSQGKLAVLDFSPPSSGVTGKIHQFYLKKIVPLLGGLVTGKKEAYSYLAASIENFPSSEELKKIILASGFSSVSVYKFTFGAVSLHLALV